MSEDSIETERRRKRARRGRRVSYLVLVIAVILPLAASACVLAEVYDLRKVLEEASAQVESLIQMTDGQQKLLEQLEGRMQALEREAAGDSGAGQSGQQGQQISGQQPEQQTSGQQSSGQQGQQTSAQRPGDVKPAQGEAVSPQETAEVTAAHKVYLTFDDGPSIYTQDILDILDRYDVKATFFVLGKENESMKEKLKDIADAGHTIGMHSYTHEYSEVYASVESFAGDLAKIQDYIYDVTGVWSTVYRFPGGSSNKVSKISMDTFAKYLDGQGIVFFDWNSSSGDGGPVLLPVETIVENCMKGISKRDTTVILMHDAAGKRTTVDALPKLIESIQALEDTVILPITENTKPIQHIQWESDAEDVAE